MLQYCLQCYGYREIKFKTFHGKNKFKTEVKVPPWADQGDE